MQFILSFHVAVSFVFFKLESLDLRQMFYWEIFFFQQQRAFKCYKRNSEVLFNHSGY